MKILSNFKKALMLLVATAFCATTFAINPPDEGMWLPMFIKNYNYAEMQRLGLRLTAEHLASESAIVLRLGKKKYAVVVIR